MIQHSPRERIVAIALAGLAGYVDALAFLSLGGYFVSFMSGNTTRLGASVAEGLPAALLPMALIALFVCGVVLGSLVARNAGVCRPQLVMGLVGGLLTVAAVAGALGWTGVAIAAMALAMGAENAVFERNGEVSIGLTYMTGALVKLGQRLTAALVGGDRWGWVWYLFLWLGLTIGAVAGATSWFALGLSALWLAAVTALAVALYLAVRPFERQAA